MKRLIAIGDIHGHLNLLDDLLSQIEPKQEDQFVFLGDYIDRGPNSKGVIDALIDFKLLHSGTVFLRGNHEQMFLDALNRCGKIEGWRLAEISEEWAKELGRCSDIMIFRNNGGNPSLKSYGVEICQDGSGFTLLGDIPSDHIDFLQATQFFYQEGKFIFAHAGINPYLPLTEQAIYTLLWDRDLGGAPEKKTLVIGHTPCPEGEPLIADDLIMLDTGAGYSRPLTAMDLLTGKIWQAKHP